jgi:hypothetical protein
MQAVWATQLPLAFNPIGEHQTFLLERDLIYTVRFEEAKSDTPQRVRVQVTGDVWVRLDGGEPAVNRGFLITEGPPRDYFIQVSDGEVKLMTDRQNVWLQGQWLGFPLNGEEA